MISDDRWRPMNGVLAEIGRSGLPSRSCSFGMLSSRGPSRDRRYPSSSTRPGARRTSRSRRVVTCSRYGGRLTPRGGQRNCAVRRSCGPSRRRDHCDQASCAGRCGKPYRSLAQAHHQRVRGESRRLAPTRSNLYEMHGLGRHRRRSRRRCQPRQSRSQPGGLLSRASNYSAWHMMKRSGSPSESTSARFRLPADP